MKIKSQWDFWFGLLFLVVGVVFVWGVMEYFFGNLVWFGLGYFFFGLGIFFVLLGGLVLFKVLMLEFENGDLIGVIVWWLLIIIVVFIVIFGILLLWLGLVCMLFIFIMLLVLVSSEFYWCDVLISSVVLMVGSWVFFIWGLKLIILFWFIYVIG